MTTETVTESGTLEIISDYYPHDTQAVVHENKSRFKVLVCGRRWGKTTLAVNEIIVRALEPNQYIWYVAPTYRQSKMISFKLFEKYLPEILIDKVNLQDLQFKLKNGSIIELKGSDNEDSLRGVGLNFVVLDEFSSMTANVWDEIIRPMLTDTQGDALFIGTPKGKNHFWELYMRGQRGDAGYQSWQFKTTDNTSIPYMTEEVAEAKSQVNERYFRQEYEASFEDFTGLIYPEFNKEHLIDYYGPPDYWKRIGAIDVAVSGTTGVLKIAIDEDNRLLIYDEYYETDQRVSEVVQAIKEDNFEWYIDPSSKAKSLRGKDGNLYSLYDEYTDYGINATCAENDVMAGINRVGEYFKSGKIKIMRNCKHLIWELERYHWAETKESSAGDIKPKPYKSQDHLVDCLRYLVMSRSKKREARPIRSLHKMSVAYDMAQMEAGKTSWKDKY